MGNSELELISTLVGGCPAAHGVNDDFYTRNELTARLKAIVTPVKRLQPEDQRQIQFLLRAAILGITRRHSETLPMESWTHLARARFAAGAPGAGQIVTVRIVAEKLTALTGLSALTGFSQTSRGPATGT